MRVDPAVEPKVREALAGAVAQDPERFRNGVLGLGETDSEYLAALELAFNIVAGAVFAIDEGEVPSDDRIGELAADFSKTSTWSDVSGQAAYDLLMAIFAERNPLEAMNPADAAFTSLALGAWLLAGFEMPSMPEWTDFLDVVLLGLEQRGTE
ncbi:hypothetical protein [Kineosporia babensis]|uniref:Uncharacterized protein n=1 Tax=Kineosporia babensis TaxID=499548 RepID=A0A9X1NN73_9ACTN|nr:hypothetical protein [Kineosporia babensis]MCD5316609.1 hypothetical protein [Kineosporia babensis]